MLCIRASRRSSSFGAQVAQQVMLQLAFRLQILQEHTGFGKAFVGPVDPGHELQGALQQHGRVVAGEVEGGAGGLAVKPGAEGAGTGKHREAPGPLPLPPQLFRGPAHVARHRLAQLLFAAHRPAEAAADAGFLFGARAVIEGQAAHPLEFQLQAQPD